MYGSACLTQITLLGTSEHQGPLLRWVVPRILKTWVQMTKEEASPPSPESHFHTLHKAGASKIKIYFFLGNECTSVRQKYAAQQACTPCTPSSVLHLIRQPTQGHKDSQCDLPAVQCARSHSLNQPWS